MTDLQIGDPLPAFQAPSTQGVFDSTQAIGRPLVLYFYPKDNTPGCTLEAQDLRDRHAAFEALGCAIYGVSRDSIDSHHGFTEKQSLPFALISDPDEALCTLFDVIKTKTRYGKPSRGIERSTFLFDANGKLAKAWRNVRVDGHAEAVLKAVQALSA